MVTDGGGWTVFQRRMDGSTNFYRGWGEYKRGFGNKSREFWLGLDAIHELTRRGSASLRVELTTAAGSKYYAKYTNFGIGTESSEYKLVISRYSGTAGNWLARHHGAGFTTKDRDNDFWSGNCAVHRNGAWWYVSCVDSDLNSRYSNMFWHRIPTIKFAEMKIRGRANEYTVFIFTLHSISTFTLHFFFRY